MTQNFLIHAEANVDPSIFIPNGVKILKNAVLEKDVTLGDQVIIGAGVKIRKGCALGHNVILKGFLPENQSIRYLDQPNDITQIEKNPEEDKDRDLESSDPKAPEKIETVLEENCHIGTGTVISKGVILHPNVNIGENCVIEPFVEIGEGTIIANQCVIHENLTLASKSVLGENTILKKDSRFEFPINLLEGVLVGENVRIIQTQKLRAITPDGTARSQVEIEMKPVYIHKGVFVGDHVTLVSDTTIGNWAMIANHAYVSKYVPNNTIISGKNQLRGFVCACETIIELPDEINPETESITFTCPNCGQEIREYTGDVRKVQDPISKKAILQKFLSEQNPLSENEEKENSPKDKTAAEADDEKKRY